MRAFSLNDSPAGPLHLGEGLTFTVGPRPPGPALFQLIMVAGAPGHWNRDRWEPGSVWWVGAEASWQEWSGSPQTQWLVLAGEQLWDRGGSGVWADLTADPRPTPVPELAADLRELAQIAFQCSYSCELKELLAFGKSLMLLSKAAHLLRHPRREPSYRVRFFRDDLDKVREARSLLMDRMAAPPNLHELARQVGLNEVKLKAGFQKLWGTTVFGLLRRERMEAARLLLASGECNVSEAAFRVGYTNTSHFARSFVREFGLRPSEVCGSPEGASNLIPAGTPPAR